MARRAEPFSSTRPSWEYLTHRGPHEVVAGTLDEIGLPGVVFAPETGPRCPLLVFGHGYLQPVDRYGYLLRHLASWGFVAAAPATERGIAPSAAGLALDMARVWDRLAEAKLHRGRVTVDRKRLALAGHGVGGAAAVLAAAEAPTKAVVTVFASAAAALSAAPRVNAPALHIVAGADGMVDEDEGGAVLAARWGGESRLAVIKRARHLSATEGKHLSSTLLGQPGSAKVRASVSLWTTAFALCHAAGQSQLADEIDKEFPATHPAEMTI